MIAQGRRRAQESVCSSRGGSGKTARGSTLATLVPSGGYAMKNIGIIAIVAGVLVIILGLAGVLGQGGNVRTVMVGAVILLAVGFLLYRRGQSGRTS